MDVDLRYPNAVDLHHDLAIKRPAHTHTHTVISAGVDTFSLSFRSPCPGILWQMGCCRSLAALSVKNTKYDECRRSRNTMNQLIRDVYYLGARRLQQPTFGDSNVFGLTHAKTSVLDRSHGGPRICIINKSVMTGRYSHRPLERNSATKYSSMGPHEPPSPQKKKKKEYWNR